MLNQPGIVPSQAARDYASETGEQISWPVKELSVIGNALLHVNSFSINRCRSGTLTNFSGKSVFVDHLLLAERVADAFATRHEETYITALYIGLYECCLDMAFTLFGARDAFIEIGDHTLEPKASDPQIVDLAVDRFASTHDYFNHLGRTMPRCPVRRNAAHVVAAIMVAFIYHHEEGHIFLGHVDHSLERLKAQRHSEHDRALVLERRLRALSHLSEIDADKYALAVLLSPLAVEYLESNYSSLKLAKSHWIWLSWIGAGLAGVLLALLDKADINLPKDWRSHPHGVLRARQTMLPSLARELAKRFSDSNCCLTAYADARISLANLAKIWLQYAVFDMAFEVGGPVDKIIERFNASITEEDQRAYRDMRAEFRLGGTGSGALIPPS